jgi:hypothetical protein
VTVCAIVFDVGETIVDETRAWSATSRRVPEQALPGLDLPIDLLRRPTRGVS